MPNRVLFNWIGDAMKIINLETWERREAYAFFSQIDYPFYAVTIPVDVTRVKEASKKRGLSFYHLMIWLCTKAVNSVEAFRLRVRGEHVVLLDRTDPSFTTLEPGKQQFQIITLPWEAEPDVFCAHAREKAKKQTAFLAQDEECDGLIYFSCTPWFDFTALSNEHNFDRDDTIPRIAWGKYYEQNGGLWLHMSIEVNHRTIDGYHLGLLKEAIDREIAAL